MLRGILRYGMDKLYMERSHDVLQDDRPADSASPPHEISYALYILDRSASFNEDYAAAARHVDPWFIGLQMHVLY